MMNSCSRICALIKEPGKAPVKRIIKNSLESFQEIVDGYIEVVRFDDVLCIINEEGKLRGDCKVNFWLNDDIIMGTAVFVGSDEKNGDFKSLSRKKIEKIMLKFGGM